MLSWNQPKILFKTGSCHVSKTLQGHCLSLTVSLLWTVVQVKFIFSHSFFHCVFWNILTWEPEPLKNKCLIFDENLYSNQWKPLLQSIYHNLQIFFLTKVTLVLFLHLLTSHNKFPWTLTRIFQNLPWFERVDPSGKYMKRPFKITS